MTDEEKKKLREHYLHLGEEAIKGKWCISCVHRIPSTITTPPGCDLGKEGMTTCSRYELSDWWQRKHNESMRKEAKTIE